MVERYSTEFGERVRALREARGVGLRKFAALVEMTPTYLSKVERGVFPPPSEKKILAIAQVLDANADELLGLADRVASDLTAIIRKHPVEMASFLRTVRGYSADDIVRMKKQEEKRKRRR